MCGTTQEDLGRFCRSNRGISGNCSKEWLSRQWSFCGTGEGLKYPLFENKLNERRKYGKVLRISLLLRFTCLQKEDHVTRFAIIRDPRF